MSRYLERISIGRYGALADCDVGPFAPGLNVVYGPNEAGKSSIASFVGGVLFGWEEAHGVRNTYRPEGAGRWGWLAFADKPPASGVPQANAAHSSGADGVDLDAGPDAESTVVRRGRDEDGAWGDGADVVADIDSVTYRTMFSLTSDELRSLRNASDVTARLLAAGTATGSSPMAALAEVHRRIAELTAPSGEKSIVELGCAIEEKRAQITEALEDSDRLRQEDLERRELVEARASADAHLDELDGEMAALGAARARLEALDAQIAARNSEIEALRVEREQVVGELAAPSATCVPGGRLASLDAAGERALRDRLDDLVDEQAKAVRSVDVAEENAAASSAAYEALLEMGTQDGAATRGKASQKVKALISVLLPLAFIAAGIAVFVFGRQSRSLSYTAFGVGLVTLAALLAAGAFAMLLRPDKGEVALEERLKDAQWVMLQDQKKLAVGIAAKERVKADIEAFLEEAGLEAANGSLRQARALLDDAREERARARVADQRLAALVMRIDAATRAVETLAGERACMLEEVGLASEAASADIDALIRERQERRDALCAVRDDMNMRSGELDERLGKALGDRTLDELKFAYHQVACRLREAKHELVELLLARRMLEKALAAWESRSQPEVYVRASQLFCALTDGAWARMRMTAEGRLVATSAAGDVRDVRHLSLGTCQQLYLALRVAMLIGADTVGKSIPIMADDILVHFDARRRARAAEVLAELATKRQVIVFTCHRQTVEALCAADPQAVCLEIAPVE